jgi:hypothetical protein
MTKYSQGKIYKLYSKTHDLVYYGSTYQTLKQRLKRHEEHYNSWLNGKHRNVSSFRVLEVGDYEIELVMDFQCKSKEELERIEGIFIRVMYDECVNIIIPGQTKEEYKEKRKGYTQKYNETHKEKRKGYTQKYNETHKEELKDYRKKYNETHKEELKDYQKKYAETHKEELKDYKKKYAETHKEELKDYKKKYAETHKEELKDYKKTYNETHKEELKKYGQKTHKSKLPIVCECGHSVRKDGITVHRKSKKHLNALKSLTVPALSIFTCPE